MDTTPGPAPVCRALKTHPISSSTRGGGCGVCVCVGGGRGGGAGGSDTVVNDVALSMTHHEIAPNYGGRVKDPTGWTLAHDNNGRQYFWHPRTRRTAWEIPESAILRMKGMRKRKKKKLPRGSSFSRSSRVRIRRCGLGRALVLRGFLMCSLPYCCCGRARRRFRQWHMLEWFCWLLLACGYIYSDMLENSCGIVSLLLVLLVMMHLVLRFLRSSMSVAIPQVQFLDQVAIATAIRPRS